MMVINQTTTCAAAADVPAIHASSARTNDDTTAAHARLTRNDVSGIWQPDGGFLQVVVSNRCPRNRHGKHFGRSVNTQKLFSDFE